MVKLKISYENMDELTKVINLLGQVVKDMKISHEQKGKYKRAYISLISLEDVEISRDND